MSQTRSKVITEDQARAIMVDVLNGLVEQVKADLPNLTRNQELAIASISFNWGYGNVKRSGLWKRIKDGSRRLIAPEINSNLQRKQVKVVKFV